MEKDSYVNLIAQYGDMLYRIAIVILKNQMDAQDAVQSTFIKYIEKSPRLASRQHLQRWLAKVCTNICIDMLRQRKRQADLHIEDIGAIYCLEESSGIFDALIKVEEKFRMVLTLHYIEGYSVDEIAKIINRTPSAVKMRLKKGRRLLKEIYEREMC